MVLSTHDLNFAASVCSSLVLLRGRPGARGRTDRPGPDDQRRPGPLRRRRRRAAARRRRAPRRHADQAGARGRGPVSAPRSLRRRFAVSLAGFGALALTSIILGPLVGSTSISLAAGLRRVDSVRRQRRRADLLRRPAAAHAGRRARRRNARRCRRGLPGAAAQSAGHAVHARRLVGRGARRDAGDHVRMDARQRRASGRPGRQLRRIDWRGGDRLHAVAGAARRSLDQHAAARRRDDERVLLGADPVRAVLRRLRRHLPDAALADGRPRRQRAISRSWRRCRC